MAKQADILPVLKLQLGEPQNRTVLSYKIDNVWHEITYAQLVEQSLKLSQFLTESNIGSSARVAILCEAAPYSGIAYLACIHIGCTVVPLDAKWSFTHLTRAVETTRPTIILVSDQYLARVQILQKQGSSISSVFLLGSGTNIPEYQRVADLQSNTAAPNIASAPHVANTAAVISYAPSNARTQQPVTVSLDTLTHETLDLKKRFNINDSDALLSVASMSDPLEFIVSFLAALTAGSRICYFPSSSAHELVRTICQKKITLMTAPHTLIKFLKLSMLKETDCWSEEQNERFKKAYRISPYLPSFRWKRILFKHLHQYLGGRLRGLISLDPLADPEVISFFKRVGIHLYSTRDFPATPT
jgi:long-subunit acyl-CoA synthetase (AMP-forming)